MLQFKDGKFHAYGLSFALPDGFYLDSDPDTPYEYGLCCCSPDETIYYGIYVDCEHEDLREGIELLFEPGSGMYQTSEIRPVVLNGLAGFEVTFYDRECDYYETHLQASEGPVLIFHAHCEKGRLADIKHHPDTQAVLQAISAD